MLQLPTGRRLREICALAVLVVICVATWCTVYGRWSREAWRVPPGFVGRGYNGDALYILSKVKAFEVGDIHPGLSKVVPHLNAPFAANWNDFPGTEEPLLYLAGLLARIVGLFPAVNLALLGAHILAATAFYATCRLLRYRATLSMAVALAFAFSRYITYRSLPHLGLAFCWYLPFCILITWWGLSGRVFTVGSARYWFSLGIAIVAGLHFPYYSNIFLQLLGFTILSQLIRGRWRNAVPLLHIAGATVLAFLLINTDTMGYALLHGANPGAVKRSLTSLENISLIPLELALPVEHRWGRLESLTENRYVSQQKNVPEDLKRQLMISSYVGVLGVLSFAWLFGLSLFLILRGEAQRVPIHTWQILWTLLYAMVGGVNWFLGVSLGIFVFRGGNRFSVVILTLLLLFLVRELSRVWPRRGGALLAVLIAAAALWDQLPQPVSAESIEESASAISSDRAFVEDLERRLPAGAMIFQLPVVDYPESAKNGVNCYEMLRPYLYSRDLRFSFGSDKGREREDWQQDLVELVPRDMVEELERIGFQGLLVHTIYYGGGATKLLSELRTVTSGHPLVSAAGNLVFLPLSPRPVPDPVVAVFPPGWSSLRDAEDVRRRWGRNGAEIPLFNPSRRPRVTTLRFRMRARRRMAVAIYQGDTRLLMADLQAERREPEEISVRLKPGANRLRFLAFGGSSERFAIEGFRIVD